MQKYPLLQFIQQFDPCYSSCGDDYQFLCTKTIFENGICDKACNTEACNYDGGE